VRARPRVVRVASVRIAAVRVAITAVDLPRSSLPVALGGSVIEVRVHDGATVNHDGAFGIAVVALIVDLCNGTTIVTVPAELAGSIDRAVEM
jgi:hypothetical protein